jgi:hypothetical protein
MKKFFTAGAFTAFIVLFSYCSSSKKMANAKPLTYETSLTSIISEKCSPCHIPDKGGKKKAYNTYESVRMDIDEIIRRISLNPGEKGFMPFKHDKLSDSTITVFKQWKQDGMRER